MLNHFGDADFCNCLCKMVLSKRGYINSCQIDDCGQCVHRSQGVDCFKGYTLL